MKTSGADVVLIDPQFAPMMVARRTPMPWCICWRPRRSAQNVDLFQRFAVMRHWRNVAHLPFSAFISPDDLHMNDWSLAASPSCWAVRSPKRPPAPP